MKQQDVLSELLSRGVILLDGATGTQLHQAGLKSGLNPEQWVLSHPDVLKRLQIQYMEAGSDIIYTFTFGANRIKLGQAASSAEHSDSVVSINQELALLSMRARDQFCEHHPDRIVLVAGDLAPTGLFLKPAGDLDFDELVEIYQEQVRGQLAAGVDLFVIETMMDLAQMRAAILAVQSLSSKPILASMTVAENGKTIAGNTPLACLLTCAALGVSAFGLNCSFGPDKLAFILEPLLEISPIPLLLKPNAGLPQWIDGQTIFPMDEEAFAKAMKKPLEAGIQLVGGCCGTGPSHIAVLKQLALSFGSENLKPRAADLSRWISSSRSSLLWHPQEKLPYVDASRPDLLIDQVLDVMDEGPAIILDFTSYPENQTEILPNLLQELQLTATLPFIFRCHQPRLIEVLLRYYHGRAGLQTNLAPISQSALYGALLDK
ncbi:MAG: homocysteine S-methyltransferase family protein [Clostridia bacterium]|nr:homocysteine S-methyltransferase family protein [Clostridia bacterium]